MPAQSRTFRKSFRWREVDGAPLAAVTVLNGRGWIFCCPLCGCIHEVSGGQLDGRYAPNCLLRQLAQQAAPVGRPAEYGANWARVKLALELKPALEEQARERKDANLKQGTTVPDVANLPHRENGRTRDKAAARAKRATIGAKRGRPRKDKAA